MQRPINVNREDHVTEAEHMPKWLCKDVLSPEVWIFLVTEFPFVQIINRPGLLNWNEVGQWGWKDFESAVNFCVHKCHIELAKFYKYGVSAIFRRQFAVAISVTFPYLGKRYLQLRGEMDFPRTKALEATYTFSVKNIIACIYTCTKCLY